MLGFPRKPSILLFFFFVKNPSSASSSLRPFLSFLQPFSSFPYPHSPLLLPFSPPSIAPDRLLDLSPIDIAASFKEWFRSRDPSVFDLIFKIISSRDPDVDAALARLDLRLNEEFVLQALCHLRSRPNAGVDAVLPCLKFFEWAGRQRGFHHTRATFHAMLKILSRARLMSVMLDFVHTFTAAHRNHHRARFQDTLVMGYAVAGKPDVALHLFAKMRFQGLDLDPFAYHVLLNALVEESCFDVADVVSKQISLRRLDNEVTACIRMKNLCKQNRLDDAEAYLRRLGGSLNEHVIGVLVNALCRHKRFEEACALVEEFGQSGKVPMAPTYGVWIRDLINAGKVDGALDFFQTKKRTEGYVPPVLCYNKLICGLLRENRLAEVYDLLVEMREEQIAPDGMTMNAALCFFCKAGMVDVALELYKSRLEIGLTPNSLAYNHLINALCGDGSVDEACRVLADSLKQGYFPGRKAFQSLADALCREGKLDKFLKLVDVALKRNIRPSNAVCVKYISALCKAGKADEGYLESSKLVRPNRYTYANMIRGFSELKRGDMASKLLLEMQESGHTPSRSLHRAVICCLCQTGNAEQVFNLLELLSSNKNVAEIRRIYNYFIDGVGHAVKPEIARALFERMSMRGIQPNTDTNILMMQSYLKSKHISEALNFFNDLAGGHEPSTRLYNIMIVGLCKAGKPGHALAMWSEVREKGIVPSLHCYEELVFVLCTSGSYDMVVKVLKDFQKTGRHVSSFICNVLLLHTLKKPELNRAWVQSSDRDGEESSSLGSSMLGQLVGAFSGGIRVKEEHLNSLEEVIEQFFPVDIYTCNMLLRGLTMEGRMDCACDLFHRICMKGYEPNRWTYDIVVHGFCKHGRRQEAERWMEAMYRRGFNPTWYTLRIYNNLNINGE